MVPTIPFPPLPDWLPMAAEDRPVALCRFGDDLRDLAVDFGGLERPFLVTSLLAYCSRTQSGSPPAEQAIWDLPLGTRIEAIVALAAGDSAPLIWRVRCSHADCGADGELELRPAEVAALTAKAHRQKLVPVQIETRTAWLRRPTGLDQRHWLESGTEETSRMAASLFVEPAFEDLGVDGVALENAGDSIDRAMEDYDPLVGFHVEVGCAECGRITLHAPDLLAGALERLWLAQFDLVEQVHQLASHYHWSEENIAKLPLWRRRAYLAYIDGGEL